MLKSCYYCEHYYYCLRNYDDVDDIAIHRLTKALVLDNDCYKEKDNDRQRTDRLSVQM